MQKNDRGIWRGVDIKRRLSEFPNIWIKTKELNSILKLVAHKIEFVTLTQEAQGVLVVCESGGGKTALTRELGRLYPDVDLEDSTQRQMVLMDIPSTCSKATLAKALLHALKDPAWESGKATENLARAIKLIRTCSVKILAVDNFHDIPERRDVKGVRAIGNWFRDLLDKVPVVFVALGTKEAKEVRLNNFQVRRRVMATKHINYFTLDTFEGRLAWKTMMKDIDDALPLAEASGLEKLPLSGLLFQASNGVFDYLITLLKYALPLAVRRGAERIEISDFEEAFILVNGDVATQGNPFSPGFECRLLTRYPDDPFYELPASKGAQVLEEIADGASI